MEAMQASGTIKAAPSLPQAPLPSPRSSSLPPPSSLLPPHPSLGGSSPSVSSLPSPWRLPFSRQRALLSLRSAGRCVQGNNQPFSHHNELSFAFDFELPVGTPVLAARDGTVIAVCDHFKGRGSKPEHKARANYIALRHSDGCYSRYYHLKHGGAHVRVGQHVAQGEQIGLSGNTGFSGGPHLHFDVTDRLPTDIVTLSVSPAGAARATSRTLECHVASFSGKLPPHGDIMSARAVWADPPRAEEPTLRNCAQVTGAFVLVYRCQDVDFWDKVKRIEAAGAAAALVVNTEPSETLHIMAVPKQLRESLHSAEPFPSVSIPALMISRTSGLVIDEMATRGGGEAVLELRRSDTCPEELERSDRTLSPYAPLTQPIRFNLPGYSEGYLPVTGVCGMPKNTTQPFIA